MIDVIRISQFFVQINDFENFFHFFAEKGVRFCEKVGLFIGGFLSLWRKLVFYGFQE